MGGLSDHRICKLVTKSTAKIAAIVCELKWLKENLADFLSDYLRAHLSDYLKAHLIDYLRAHLSDYLRAHLSDYLSKKRPRATGL